MPYSVIDQWRPRRLLPDTYPMADIPATSGNPWEGFLEKEPRAAYSNWQGRFNRPFNPPVGVRDPLGNVNYPRNPNLQRFSPNQRQYFSGQFDELYNEYLGNLAGHAKTGQTPTGKWSDFLEGLNPFGRWQQMTPRQRGEDTGRFAPPVRWQF